MITVARGRNCPTRTLNAGLRDNAVGLFTHDDASGRQRWLVEPVKGKPGYSTIKLTGGRDPGLESYISAGGVNEDVVTLWFRDEGTGHQHWHIPGAQGRLTKIEIEDVVFDLSKTATLGTSQAASSYPITIENDDDEASDPVEMQVCSSTEVTESWASSQTDAFSASLTVGASATVSVEGGAVFAKASASATVSFEASIGAETSRTVDTGKSKTETQEVCVTLSCTAAPRSKKTCLALDSRGKLSVPYTATEVRHYEDGSVVSSAISGTYQSASSYGISQSIVSSPIVKK